MMVEIGHVVVMWFPIKVRTCVCTGLWYIVIVLAWCVRYRSIMMVIIGHVVITWFQVKVRTLMWKLDFLIKSVRVISISILFANFLIFFRSCFVMSVPVLLAFIPYRIISRRSDSSIRFLSFRLSISFAAGRLVCLSVCLSEFVFVPPRASACGKRT